MPVWERILMNSAARWRCPRWPSEAPTMMTKFRGRIFPVINVVLLVQYVSGELDGRWRRRENYRITIMDFKRKFFFAHNVFDSQPSYIWLPLKRLEAIDQYVVKFSFQTTFKVRVASTDFFYQKKKRKYRVFFASRRITRRTGLPISYVICEKSYVSKRALNSDKVQAEFFCTPWRVGYVLSNSEFATVPAAAVDR